MSRTVTVASEPIGATIWEKEGRDYTCTNAVTPASVDLTFHAENDAKQLLLKKFGYRSQKITLDAAHDKATAALAMWGLLFRDADDTSPELRSLNARLREEFERVFMTGGDAFSCVPLEFHSLDLVKGSEEKQLALHLSLLLIPSEPESRLRAARRTRGDPTERVNKMGQVVVEAGVADIIARFGAVAAKFPEIKDILIDCSYSTTQAVLDTEAFPIWYNTYDNSVPITHMRRNFTRGKHTVVVDKDTFGTLTIAIPLAKVPPQSADKKVITSAVLAAGKISVSESTE